MRKQFVILCALASVLFASAAFGQKCEATDTVEKCWQRFNPAIATVAAKVATANTGVPGLTLPNGSSLRDFLSLFSAAFQTATVKESENAVTLDSNLPFNVVGDGKVKFQAIFNRPTLSKQLTDAVGNQPTAITRLTDSLSETDDVEASATYAPQNAVLGRSIRPHDELLSALLDSATGEADTRQLRLLAVIAETLKAHPDPPFTRQTLWQDLPQAAADQIVASARAEKEIAAQERSVVAAFATLLNNQPQLYGSVIHHRQNRFVGANETSGKLTYEVSTNSLNRFLKQNSRCGVADIKRQNNGLTDSTSCVSAFAAFARNAERDAKAGASSRLALSIEYKQTQANRFELSDPAVVTVNTPHAHSVVYSLKYGMPMPTAMPDREGRFEFAVDYDNVSDDAQRNDRFIGSITYVQKLTDTLTVPLSLIYANHGTYLPDTAHKLGVHFGLSYKLPELPK
ncbi:MAG TPA: hypothetical protein VJ276_14600 [Thermoanaerobaculia bacterium]|nr:hypothetical protein [Thermoanaerobaculia bacterium]